MSQAAKRKQNGLREFSASDSNAQRDMRLGMLGRCRSVVGRSVHRKSQPRWKFVRESCLRLGTRYHRECRLAQRGIRRESNGYKNQGRLPSHPVLRQSEVYTNHCSQVKNLAINMNSTSFSESETHHVSSWQQQRQLLHPPRNERTVHFLQIQDRHILCTPPFQRPRIWNRKRR